tara:strand:+ start:203 stop:886 length:684 start_codon:yes stop_codon:yes gene_type:complete
MEIINITKSINGATQNIWDKGIIGNDYWVEKNLLIDNGNTEKYRQTLYIHVIKNNENYSIWDNNGKIEAEARQGPKKVIYPNSYMIKFGKTDYYKNPKEKWKGIINRRQDDFKLHYHKRHDIPHKYKVSLNPSSKKGTNSSRLRIGSKSTILHLIMDLNKFNASIIANYERQLIRKMKSVFLNNSNFTNSKLIPRERINIPIKTINEDDLLEKIEYTFTEFKKNINI